MQWARSVCTLQLIHLTSNCPGSGTNCVVGRISACQSRLRATITSPFRFKHSLFLIVGSIACPITLSCSAMTITCPVPRQLRYVISIVFRSCTQLQLPLGHCLRGVASGHHNQTPATTLAYFAPAQHWAASLAKMPVSSMVFMTTDCSARVTHFMHSVIRPCLCSLMTTLLTSAADVGFWCSTL